MTFKGRILLALVHFIARIQGAVMWIKRRTRGARPKPPGPERVLILMAEGPIIHFMAVAFHADKILEQYGVVGQPSPCEQHPIAIRDNIQARIDELLEEGYARLDAFDTAVDVTLSAPASDLPGDPTALQAWLAGLADYLVDRGLGLIGEARTDGPEVQVGVTVSSAALAVPLIAAYARAGDFSALKPEDTHA